MHLIAHLNAPAAHQVGIGLEVVHDLGRQPADVDGVGGGQAHAGQILFRAGGEDLLHSGLGIVKIAADGADFHIAALLRDHLGLLHGGHAAVGIKDNNSGAGYIVKALQSRLAGVSGGGSEDEHFVRNALHAPGLADEQGQQAQGHVFKCAGGTTEQLQHIAIPHLDQRGQFLRFKLARIATADKGIHIRIVRQQGREDPGGHGESIFLYKRLPIHRWNGLRHIQTAIRGDTPQHRGGRGRCEGTVTSALIFHTSFSNLFLAFCIMI